MTDLTRTSRFLSQHLRHQPEAIGLVLRPGGWVRVDELLAACTLHGHPLSRDTLDRIVRESDKQRFGYDASRERIRANQGHTTAVQLDFEPLTPPSRLYHGTATRFLPDILQDGLKRMRRHHVHLSGDPETASKVGVRHGTLALLEIDAQAMSEAGFAFYRSANGVWLVDEVPPAFLHVLKPEA